MNFDNRNNGGRYNGGGQQPQGQQNQFSRNFNNVVQSALFGNDSQPTFGNNNRNSQGQGGWQKNNADNNNPQNDNNNQPQNQQHSRFPQRNNDTFNGGNNNNNPRYGNQNNRQQGNTQGQDYSGNQGTRTPYQKQNVLTLIDKFALQALQEQFTNCSVSNAFSQQGQQQQQQPQMLGYGQQQQQPVQAGPERLQILFSTQDKFQVYVGTKAYPGIKFFSSSVFAIENQNPMKIDRCFTIKNPLQNGRDLIAFATQNTQTNLYYISLMQTTANDPIQLEAIPYEIAHNGAISQVFSFQNLIVTVSQSDSISPVKFWRLNQNLNKLDFDTQTTTLFQRELTKQLTILNIVKEVPIQTLEFFPIEGQQQIGIILSFKYFQYAGSEATQLPTQNTIYMFLFDITTANAQTNGLKFYKKIDIGLSSASIVKTNTYHFGGNFWTFILQSNWAPKGQNIEIKGYFQCLKNFQELKTVYESRFPITDTFIAGLNNPPQNSTSKAVIIIASSRSIVPISWQIGSDSFKEHQSDGTLWEHGDIQKVYLFKNIINLVEINELITVHYPLNSSSEKQGKTIALSSLSLFDKFEKKPYQQTQGNNYTHNNNYHNNNNNNYNKSNNNNNYNNQNQVQDNNEQDTPNAGGFGGDNRPNNFNKRPRNNNNNYRNPKFQSNN